MPVFFIPSHTIKNQTILIEGPLFEHLTRSLRYREGDKIVVCDDTRHRHHIHIQSIKKAQLAGTILTTEKGPPPKGTTIILGQALLKGEHMNWALQKATELGVSTIVPLLTARVIVRPKGDRFHSLQERYNRIARDAAQQAEHWAVPEVLSPTEIPTFFKNYRQAELKTILVERGDRTGLESLHLNNKTTGNIVIAVGPEGGWSPEESQLAQQNDFTPLSLGAPILRGETASLAALSIIQFQLGNLD